MSVGAKNVVTGTVAYLLKAMAIPMAHKVHTSMRN